MLYKVADFHFNSPTLMYNYLSCINPAHKASIRSVELQMRLIYNASAIPRKVFLTLSELPLLQFLEIDLNCGWRLCGPPTTTTAKWVKKFILQEKYLTKIEKSKFWGDLKGLKQFDIKFTSYDGMLDEKNARMIAAREEIRRAVMGK